MALDLDSYGDDWPPKLDSPGPKLVGMQIVADSNSYSKLSKMIFLHHLTPTLLNTSDFFDFDSLPH